ncbi:ABC transporter ATP-binding protein [Anoxybacterium hadale]|uniref:ABC transporter ATP-binding protein n=1 Tax=Anoxybacterium hadale TaxID=3408580 RepID=A0ACD1A9E2_9FIRM|nr:ABC transporter ATP-binding protein [Clostridiales bacterium]
MDELLIKGENLVKEYGGVVKTRALNGVDLKIGNREFSCIIGPSGCGKSTLLNLLGALDRPDGGSLQFRGIELSSMSENELAAFRNKSIGFVFQFHHLLPEFNALENVLLPSWIKTGRVNQNRQKHAIELLELVGLEGKIMNPANNLSGGQQQRVSIARALINSPELVLADEPTGNLDSESTEQVYELLRMINREMGTTFLIVTHDRNIAQKCDRIIEMKDGRIISD